MLMPAISLYAWHMYIHKHMVFFFLSVNWIFSLRMWNVNWDGLLQTETPSFPFS